MIKQKVKLGSMIKCSASILKFVLVVRFFFFFCFSKNQILLIVRFFLLLRLHRISITFPYIWLVNCMNKHKPLLKTVLIMSVNLEKKKKKKRGGQLFGVIWKTNKRRTIWAKWWWKRKRKKEKLKRKCYLLTYC